MVQAGIGGLDTPRTNIGDATYLSNQQLDFDISQEQSFQSPSKDNNNLLQQLQNGRRGAINLKTPRSRAALVDRRNVPAGLGGGEFTPLLKSATRNSALRIGKENVPQTPAFLKPGALDKISEDLTPVPGSSSVYGESRNGSYMAGTPMPQVQSSSASSTPMALLPRRNDGPGVLQDGNQLSLREQENVIDKIEKENFGLKLKIHFLEEALRKAGPGFSEATLKENTDLKVDKVTMQKELLRYRKTLSSAEKDVELYRQQFLEAQDAIKKKHINQDQQDEVRRLQEALEDREAELKQLRGQKEQFEDLQDKVHDLEVELREKERLSDDREDEVENLKDEIEKRDETISRLEQAAKDSQRRAVELEEMAQAGEELEDAQETIKELEQDLKKAQEEAEEARENEDEAVREKGRAQANLEELQDEMANKSITTKGLRRQIEEKANRLQDELEDLREAHTTLGQEHDGKVRDVAKLQKKIDALQQDADAQQQQLQDRIAALQREGEVQEHQLQDRIQALQRDGGVKERQLQDRIDDLQRDSKVKEQQLQDRIDSLQRDGGLKDQKLRDKLEAAQNDLRTAARDLESFSKRAEAVQDELHQAADEKNLLQVRHDALTTESAGLQRDLARAHTNIEELEDKLDHEKTLALNNEREVRDQYKEEINRLHDEIEDLRAEVREKERQHDDESDKWDDERRNLESQKLNAEEKANGLQRAIDKLQEAEGDLSSKEMRLKAAIQGEKERHQSQEALLTRQINELNDDVQTRRTALEEVRTELTTVMEELRLSHREQKALAEKVEGLEDEVEILQTSLDDESEQANQELSLAKVEADGLRRQVQSLTQDLARAESVSAGARAELEAFQGDLQAGEGSKQQLNARLREIDAQLAGVKQEKQSLQDQIGSLNMEMHSLRSSKSDTEAERDEFHGQLKLMQQQEDGTYRLDQERMDLRTAKLKLDAEVRRLREEQKLAVAQQEAMEKELQEEIDRASAEEARLGNEILDLQRILRGSSEKKELAAAKKTIHSLEAQIQDLEFRTSGETDGVAAHELSIIRHDLFAARQKEAEFLQREQAQKDVLRGLMRQISTLERKAHEAEISKFAASPSHNSSSGSARKSEVVEVRAQLATAHQTLKEIRCQLKAVEKDSVRKLSSLNLEIQSQTTAWESERDQLERALDQANYAREDLEIKNTASEATITRLRGKIDRLEKALQTERQNSGADRTMVAERKDLHEMLRETQLQAESLELVVQERDSTIAAITAAEASLRSNLKRVREERAVFRSKGVAVVEALKNLDRKHTKAKEAWEAEKKVLTKGVRFANMSLSVNENSESQIEALKKDFAEREHHKVKEIRGLVLQTEWLMSRLKREEYFRVAAAFAKVYMQLEIDMFHACNQADIRLLESAGVQRPIRKPKPRTFRQVAQMVRSTVRMRNQAAEWKEKRVVQERIQAQWEVQQREKRAKEAREAAERMVEMEFGKEMGGKRRRSIGGGSGDGDGQLEGQGERGGMIAVLGKRREMLMEARGRRA